MKYLKKSIVGIFLAGLPILVDARTLWDIHPYLGTEVGLTKYDNAKGDATMVGVVGGLQFNDYLGLELNWLHTADKVTAKSFSSSPKNKKASLSNYGIGLTFQADLAQRVYAKSYLGANKVNSNLKWFNENVGVAKLGVGYQFSPDLAAELTYDYRFGDSNSRGMGAQLKYYF